MDRSVIIEGRIYDVRMGAVFATIIRLDPRKASGILSTWVEEITGEQPTSLVPIICNTDETIEVALKLGRKFSRAESWQNLVTFAQNFQIV